MSEEKRKLLNRFAETINDGEDIEDASVFTAEELGTPMDVVRCRISEAGADLVDMLGECYFLPVEGDDLSVFTIMVTVIDEMKEETRFLADAAARLNYFLPVGGFGIDDDDNGLVYKYSVHILNSLSDEDKMTTMLTAFNAAVGVIDKFEGCLMLVATGEMESGEMMDLIMNR